MKNVDKAKTLHTAMETENLLALFSNIVVAIPFTNKGFARKAPTTNQHHFSKE